MRIVPLAEAMAKVGRLTAWEKFDDYGLRWGELEEAVPAQLNMQLREVFSFFPGDWTFYKVPERYLGFGDKESAKQIWWQYDDPQGNWTLICKVGESFDVALVVRLLKEWTGGE